MSRDTAYFLDILLMAREQGTLCGEKRKMNFSLTASASMPLCDAWK
jgi:hypothetical protein